MAVVLRDGHSGSVLTCDVLKDGTGRIVTGGECGELCFWTHQGDRIGCTLLNYSNCSQSPDFPEFHLICCSSKCSKICQSGAN